MIDVAPVIRRAYGYPNGLTFSIPVIAELLDRWLAGREVIVDPFARNSERGTLRNDLDPKTKAGSHLRASAWLAQLGQEGILADAVLFDPPYSARQAKELYESVGLTFTARDGQVVNRWTEERDRAAGLLRPGGIGISFGWNSTGFGKGRGFDLREALLVHHGGAHNDTIVVVEEKNRSTLDGIMEPRGQAA